MKTKKLFNKKFYALTLTLILVISSCMTAFAETRYSKVSTTDGKTSVYNTITASPDSITVFTSTEPGTLMIDNIYVIIVQCKVLKTTTGETTTMNVYCNKRCTDRTYSYGFDVVPSDLSYTGVDVLEFLQIIDASIYTNFLNGSYLTTEMLNISVN